MKQNDQGTDRRFNNADSFAQAFDEAWRTETGPTSASTMAAEERLDHVLQTIRDHPFAIASPDLARQVARFRIRLLSL